MTFIVVGSGVTMLLLLQGASLAVSDVVIIGILTIVAGCLTNYLTSKYSAAEWKGAANEKFKNIETKFGELDNEQNDQWKEIRKASDGVSRVSGEVSSMRQSRGAHR